MELHFTLGSKGYGGMKQLLSVLFSVNESEQLLEEVDKDAYPAGSSMAYSFAFPDGMRQANFRTQILRAQQH
jgi:hypothetical protein